LKIIFKLLRLNKFVRFVVVNEKNLSLNYLSRLYEKFFKSKDREKKSQDYSREILTKLTTFEGKIKEIAHDQGIISIQQENILSKMNNQFNLLSTRINKIEVRQQELLSFMQLNKDKISIKILSTRIDEHEEKFGNSKQDTSPNEIQNYSQTEEIKNKHLQLEKDKQKDLEMKINLTANKD